MNALVFGRATGRLSPGALRVRFGTVWMWPGIALTEKRGPTCVPIAADVARFWITRLHGPQANESAVLGCLDVAARRLNEGDEAGAQKALEGSGLTHLSSDGAALMRAVAGSLGIAPLDLPWAYGPRLWRAEDIAAHLPLFKDYAPAAGLLAKAGGWDESKHPCVPAGSREGGRFQGGEGGAAGASPEKPIQLPEIVITPLPPSGGGIGDNGGLPLEQPPKIPEDEPLSERLRNAFVKRAARWIAKALLGAAFGPAGEFIVGLEAAAETAAWLYDKYPYIKSYLDKPKSLEELQRNVGKPEKGYEVHHIVEQTSAERDGYSREEIDAPDNIVRIPTLKHWEITGWYMKGSPEFGGLSPRAYLRSKSWDERRKIGIRALVKAGVLKP